MTSKLIVALVVLLAFAAAVATASAQTVDELAEKGAAIAKRDPVVAEARTAEPDIFYWKGFDVATGLFGDPALGGLGHTATGPGSQRIRDSLSAVGQRGFDASVTLHLGRHYGRWPGQVAWIDKKNGADRINAIMDFKNADSGPTTNELRCRGGFAPGYGGSPFESVGSRVSATGEVISTVSLYFWRTAVWTETVTGSGGVVVSEPHWEFARAGCTWLDSSDRGPYRSVRPEEPKEIRFETPANAQLRQQLHGTSLDTSPTAAERFPDAQTIPEYLRDPNHYWSFFVVNTNQGFFQVISHRYWRRDAVKAIGRVKVSPATGAPPTGAPAPPRPICDVAREARARNSPAAPGLEAQCVAVLAAKGAVIAETDPIVAAARTAEPDELYRQGFDVATAIFGNPALGAQGNTSTGPGSLGIRASLGAAGQRGFNASVTLHLSRNYRP